jgi:hypothetical protein
MEHNQCPCATDRKATENTAKPAHSSFFEVDGSAADGKGEHFASSLPKGSFFPSSFLPPGEPAAQKAFAALICYTKEEFVLAD